MSVAQTGNRRKTKKNRAAIARNGFFDLLKMALVVGGIVAAIVVGIRFYRGDTTQTLMKGDVFLNNITVNGVDMAGMTYDQGFQVMAATVEQRLNTPITLYYKDRSWPITPAALQAEMNTDHDMSRAWGFGHLGGAKQARSDAEYLKKDPFVVNTQLSYNEALLDEFLAQIKAEVDTPYVDAVVTVDKYESMKITQQSQDGMQVNTAVLKEQIVNALQQGTTPNIQIVPEVWHPQYSTEQMLECTTNQVSSCKTSTKGSNDDRIRNIRRALGAFDAFEVRPHSTYSFNKIVGKRTKANGFFPAQEFLDGGVVDGIGGGTCQASTTLYGALVRAGITIDRREQHQMTVGYIKPSLDATVSDAGNKDLVFTNNTDYPFYIYTNVDYSNATVKIFGKKPPYKIEFRSVNIEVDIPPKGYIKKPDKKRLYAINPGDVVPDPDHPGKNGWRSQGWVYYYDWETGELTDDPDYQPFCLSNDSYNPLQPTCWVYSP